MNSASVIRIEKNVDRGASTIFALACGYATYGWFAAQAQAPVLALETAAASALAYALSFKILSGVQPRARRMPVPVFDVREVEPLEAPALELTERFEPPVAAAPEPLLLEDRLDQAEPDSRVVRLFDPAAMPVTPEPGQGGDQKPSPAQSADAAQALHEALAELRRSIR